jgi:hypothetical protein
MILIYRDAGDPERDSHGLPTRGFNIVAAYEPRSQPQLPRLAVK